MKRLFLRFFEIFSLRLVALLIFVVNKVTARLSLDVSGETHNQPRARECQLWVHGANGHKERLPCQFGLFGRLPVRETRISGMLSLCVCVLFPIMYWLQSFAFTLPDCYFDTPLKA